MLICCILSVVFGMFLHSRLFSALNLLCLAILKLDNGRIDYFLHWNQPLKYMTREQTLFLLIVHTTTFTTILENLFLWLPSSWHNLEICIPCMPSIYQAVFCCLAETQGLSGWKAESGRNICYTSDKMQRYSAKVTTTDPGDWLLSNRSVARMW